jgi:MFS transporter, DHA1 family, multidrug resistance protein
MIPFIEVINMFNQEWRYLLLITVIFIAACIETDIYLPAFTDMMTYFSISADTIQSLLTWNFAGICVSGPLYGPISDSFGRKKPLMVALSLFLVGSMITLVAHTFDWMLVGRVLQGLGSGGCFTLGTAVIFDAFQKEKAIQALNKINTIIPFIMAAAPMLGGYLNNFYGFRSNFLAIAICVFASLLICLFFFDETLPKDKRTPLKMAKIANDFKQVGLSIPFWQTMLIVSLLFSAYIAFLSCISVFFVLELGVSKGALPFYQLLLLAAWLAGNLTFKQVLAKWGIQKVKMIGTGLFAFGGLILLIGGWLLPQSPLLPTIGMMLYAMGANWVQGLYFPEGMELFPDIKGITSSFLTSARLLISAFVVGIASHLYDGTIYPIVIVISFVTVVILATIFSYERKRTPAMALVSEQQFPITHA